MVANSFHDVAAGTGVDGSLERSVRRVIVLQCVTAVILAMGMAAYVWLIETDSGYAGKLWSSLYGSVLAIASTILSARSVRRASRVLTGSGAAGGSALVPVFSGLLNKLVIVGGGIAFGLIALGLEPVTVVSGYLVVQLVSAWTIYKSRVKPGKWS